MPDPRRPIPSPDARGRDFPLAALLTLAFLTAPLSPSLGQDAPLDNTSVRNLKAAQAHLRQARLGLEQASQETTPEMVERMRRLLALAEELAPLQERLVAVQAGYPRVRDASDLTQSRVELRGRLESLDARLQQDYADWCPLYEAEFQRLMTAVLSSGAGGTALRPASATSLGAFDFALKGLAAISVNLLTRDTGLAGNAERALRRSLRLRRAAIGAAALGVLTLLVLVLRRRAAGTSSALLPAGTEGAPPAAGARVLGGKFEVLGELGRGGMGVVYEARDLALRRKVALKKMREEIRQSPRDLEAFLGEARVVAALKHPHIVEIHAVLREGGEVYLVFEHVQGSPLSRWLEKGPLPLDSVRGLFAHIAAALDYAHSKKVIHRDLKPSNIMVTDDRIAKVMDFGLAHRAKLTVARLTRAAAAGTPVYMAPEQEMGTVSKESDLYALGVCVYEMAAGRLPFEGPDLLAQKRAMSFAPPSKIGLPPGLDEVIAKALQPDPRHRYHSAGELKSALDAALPKTR